MRVKDGKLHFSPFVPDQWKSYSFRLEFRGRVIKIKITADGVDAKLESGEAMDIFVKDKAVRLSA